MLIRIFAFIFLFHFTASQDCSFTSQLWGNWTTSNFDEIYINDGTLYITYTITGLTVTSFQMLCRFISGTQYVLQSSVAIVETFNNNPNLYLWMCFDVRQASDFTIYYYLNSATEVELDGYRLVANDGTSVTVTSVCTETLDVAEFNTGIKKGYETNAAAAIQCPDVILGHYTYTYTDSAGVTSCNNSVTQHVSSCDNANTTHVIVNNTGCTQVNPLYSSGGVSSCMASIYDSVDAIYYISLYNQDASPTTTFVCVAVSGASNSTVFLSMKQTACEAAQSATSPPTGGATMVLNAAYTCIPSNNDSTSTSWLWLYLLLAGLLLVAIVIAILCCVYCKKKNAEKKKRREKGMLHTTNHPLGEMSVKLDVPPTMNKFGKNGYINSKHDILQPGNRKFKRQGSRLSQIEETSLPLDYDVETWVPASSQRLSAVTRRDINVQERSPTSNGKVPSPPSPTGSRTSRSIQTQTGFKRVTNKIFMKAKAIKSLSNRLSKPKREASTLSLRTTNTNANGALPIGKGKNSIKPGPHYRRMDTDLHKSRLGTIDTIVSARKPVKMTMHPESLARSNTVVLSSARGERKASVSSVKRIPKVVHSDTLPRQNTELMPSGREETVQLPDEFNVGGASVASTSGVDQPIRHQPRDIIPPARSLSFANIRKPGASKMPWR